MITYHKIDELEGKVSKSILSNYAVNYQNLLLASIIAGFHMAYGIKGEGISMSLEIVNNIRDESEDLKERNVLVWNLCTLSEEYIEEGQYDIAGKLLDRAEFNWSRDIILGDEIGVYHVSWIEQIWLKKAKLLMYRGDCSDFQMLTDRIIMNRMNFYREACEATGETIVGDRCTYSCFELMALEERPKNILTSINMLKQAIIFKGLNIQSKYFLFPGIYKNRHLEKAYNMYSRLYYRLGETSFDNISYGYCESCRYFIEGNFCSAMYIHTTGTKACTHYEH